MIDTQVCDADPARDLDPDVRLIEAQAMLARIVASPRSDAPPRRRATAPTVRRLAVGGLLAAAAITVTLAAPMPWDHGGPGTTAAAYAVTTDADGSVHVSVRWDRLTDPAALQAALDRAGARVRILLRSGGKPDDCLASTRTSGYSPEAVNWRSPGAVNGGFTVRPADFPTGGTFVVAVYLAPPGTHGLSTFAPSKPQLEGFSASMVIGPLPSCAS